MKELTAAQGKLRCGECASVFNAMDSLSTKLPEQSDPSQALNEEMLNQKPPESLGVTEPTRASGAVNTVTPSSTLWPTIIASVLLLTLITQIWLTRDLWFSSVRHPEQVNMLSRKVFTHPSQPEALIITGSIQNSAPRAQPYPYLEARLLDQNDEVIALRRFRPHEYLEDFQKDQLLESKQLASIRLKIQDPPGNRATQFKFSFL